MGFFHGLGSKISNGVSFLGNKLASGASWLGDKVGKVGDFVSSAAQHAAPVLAAINPELGAAAAGVGAAAHLASGIGKGVSNSINSYRDNPVRNLGDSNLFH